MKYYGLIDGSDSSLKSFLNKLSGVDAVGADARASMLATRSIKTSSKRWAIDTAISMVDLTTLEGADTEDKVQALCAKAVRPNPNDLSVPSVGAVCVYNDMVSIARKHLDLIGGSHVPVAAVTTAFPSGRASMEVKIQDTKDAIAAGASEIDMVIDRGAFLSGRYIDVFNEIVLIKEICADKAHLKVIFETGELVTYDNVRKASYLAMLAGAHFIKTSTGKVSPAATPPVVLVMLEAVRDFYEMTGVR
ncbi:MAG: deoxyribose-phosphate aldolase, partial [Actinobacteria bacterium]|nr:deoxyribose-phosphate aldolase [Actinomycetota bacterium]MSY94245.1 deoxyribose-phosphate aldolase [Actinomycetota bacterium]